MPAQLLHVVQAFTATDDGVIAAASVPCQSASQARALAAQLAEASVGVVAWSRSANPDACEYGEPEELVRLGAVPDWFDEGGGVE